MARCGHGHHSHGDQSRDFFRHSSGESLTVHGVQLLGYVSMINPASPGLNSSDFLKKPDH
jgi:hypothetical protein